MQHLLKARVDGRLVRLGANCSRQTRVQRGDGRPKRQSLVVNAGRERGQTLLDTRETARQRSNGPIYICACGKPGNRGLNVTNVALGGRHAARQRRQICGCGLGPDRSCERRNAALVGRHSRAQRRQICSCCFSSETRRERSDVALVGRHAARQRSQVSGSGLCGKTRGNCGNVTLVGGDAARQPRHVGGVCLGANSCGQTLHIGRQRGDGRCHRLFNKHLNAVDRGQCLAQHHCRLGAKLNENVRTTQDELCVLCENLGLNQLAALQGIAAVAGPCTSTRCRCTACSRRTQRKMRCPCGPLQPAPAPQRDPIAL
eukprot:m.179283 g.179283  ORF g.179283 m.179283 type:complete len:315 (+) comp10457_c0_seq1:680-1624(+)